MSRPRAKTPEGVTVKPIARIIDDGVRASGWTLMQIVAKVNALPLAQGKDKPSLLSRSTLSSWCQGWRLSEGHPIVAAPKDDDPFTTLAPVLDLRPSDLELCGYSYTAMIVRGSNETREQDNPLARFSARELADELSRRLAEQA